MWMDSLELPCKGKKCKDRKGPAATRSWPQGTRTQKVSDEA